MTTTQIQCFLAVAIEESFSKAAEKMFISHQALSKHIRTLEAEMGIVLLDRSNKRRVVLTDAGKVMFDAWTEIHRIAEEAIERAKRIQEAEERSLIIGIQDMKFVRSYVVPLIRTIQSSNVEISLEYRLGSPVELFRMLDSEEVDMLIMISSDINENTRLQTVVLCENALNLVVAMSKHHPLAKRKKVTLKDLEDETILMIDSSYSGEAAKRFQKDLVTHDFHPKTVKTFNGPRAINIAVETGLGIGLLFDELLEEARDEIKTFPVNLKNAEGTDMLLVWKERKFDMLAKQLLEMSRNPE